MEKYIVIGAGILGASTAYQLAKQGGSVVLIDRFDNGQATDAGAGIICPWLTNRRNKAWYQLVERGAALYPDLIDELYYMGENTTGYQQVGAINIYDTEKKLDNKMQIARQRRQHSPEMGEVTKLAPTETNRLFPLLHEKYSAVHISGAARVNGRAIRNSLIFAAKKLGVEFIHGDAALECDGPVVHGAKVNGKSLTAEKVIVTGGAWAEKLLKPLGVNFLVTSQKAQIIHLELPNTDTSSWPVVMAPYNQYMLTFGSNKIVLGTTHEDQVGLDNRVTVSGIHEILDKALKVAPGIANTTYLETRVGFRPFTPGYLPVIGQVPNVPGLLVANGLGASGLTSGPYIGLQLARLALGKTTELNMEDYEVSKAMNTKL